MKVIDLLNKIANGEIDSNVKFSTMYDYCNIKGYTHRYVLNEDTLNEKIKSIDGCVEDISKEEKKIPKKIDYIVEKNEGLFGEYNDYYLPFEKANVGLCDVDKFIIDKINEIIDCLKSKGDSNE